MVLSLARRSAISGKTDQSSVQIQKILNVIRIRVLQGGKFTGPKPAVFSLLYGGMASIDPPPEVILSVMLQGDSFWGFIRYRVLGVQGVQNFHPL